MQARYAPQVFTVLRVATTVFLGLKEPELWGTSLMPIGFGAPLCAADRIVFRGPYFDSGRLLCVAKDGKTKHWEIESSTGRVVPLCIDGEEVLLLKGLEFGRCELGSGGWRALGTVPYDYCMFVGRATNTVFVIGCRGKQDFLISLDTRSGLTHWERADVISLVGVSGQRAFACKSGRSSEDTARIPPRVLALSMRDGSELWSQGVRDGLFCKGLLSGNYLAVDTGWSLNCYEQQSGRLAGTLKTCDSEMEHSGIPNPVTLTTWRSNLVIWAKTGRAGESANEIYSLALPAMTKRTLAKPDRKAATCSVTDDVIIGHTLGGTRAYDLKTGQKLWEILTDEGEEVSEGYLYYSKDIIDYSMGVAREHRMTVNRIRITTGVSELLYEEKYSGRPKESAGRSP